MEQYHPLMLNALMGSPGERSDSYMAVAVEKAEAEQRAREARRKARYGWTEYHTPKLTGNAVTDAWERAILEGRDPDW